MTESLQAPQNGLPEQLLPQAAYNLQRPLDHSLALRVSRKGYLSPQITMTEGAFEWVSLNGHHHRPNCFWLRSDRFEVKLEPIPAGSHPVETIDNEGPVPPAPRACFACARKDRKRTARGESRVRANGHRYLCGRQLATTRTCALRFVRSRHNRRAFFRAER